jgi:hypothetical protein
MSPIIISESKSKGLERFQLITIFLFLSLSIKIAKLKKYQK